MTLRVGLGLALVLGVLYVASPWLLPAETIRRHVEASLAQRLGTSVSLGAMRIGWGEGVVIDGLAIQNPPGFSDGPMVQIGRIRCDFSPLQLLLRQRIAWMDVEKLTVRAEDDPAGRLNVECLSRLPTNVDTHRLRVRQSEFSVFLHDQPRPLTANVSDLQIHRLRSGPGHVTMTGSFQQSGSPAPITLRMSVGGQEEHAVLVDCRFSNLDLAQLPRSRSVWGDLPIESLRGRCGGQLVFELGRNLRVEELRLELLAENLVVKPRGVEALPKIDRAGLQLDAELDALSERADVRRFHLRLPGLQLDGSGVLYADLLRGDWEALDSLRLHGTVHPERLLALLTGRETLLDDLSVRGAVQFAAVAQQQRDVLGVDLSLDAGAACIRTKGRVLKPADRPLRLQWQGGAQRADDACRINVDHARLVVGENSITAAGHIEDIRAFRPPETAQRDSPAVLSALLKALRGVRLNGALELKEPQ
ncbi:MAG: hypothetical protein JW849_07655, partial [Phycisphaerae bacterium]|nr:hypothetical protein [Phycisphaerae bacterium]